MARYRIEINKEVCFGDKKCVDFAPDTFTMDENDRVSVTNPEGNWPEYILKAAKWCPNDAISLYDADTGERIWPEE